ncbi:hypothetical protein [Amnibacterium sp.]|uniref:hypothetical protein n=1 Tax=Amnibacterium sp. TaxID=1872496 RepID=UPI002605C3D8|nr:hypothetical protein [Amnibacterium sp.]MCU1474068.1 hypothetical protein [Amnibacterium sp.]
MVSVAAPARPAPARPRRTDRPRWRPEALLLGIAGVLVAGWHVDVPALWRDEAASVGAALRTWPALGGMVDRVDAVHATYYAFLHVWFAAVGYTPFTLRLPSVLAAGGTAAVVTVLGARLAGRRGGMASGAVAAVLPSLVWAGGEGRSYAISALLASAATLALVHALGPHRSALATAGAWAGHAALLALATVVFLDDLLLAAAHVVTALLLGRGRQRFGGLAAAVAATLAVLPLLRLATAQTGQVGWIAAYVPASPWHQLAVEQWFRSDLVAKTVLVVLVAGAIAAVVRRRVPAGALAVVLPWALLPPAGLLAAGLVTAPVYWPRYVTFTAPAVALLVGLAAAALPRLIGVIAVLAIAATAVPQIVADREPHAKAGSEMGDAAALVAAERGPSDGPAGIVFGQYNGIRGVTTRIEAIAYPEDFRGLRDLTATGPLADSTALFGSDIGATAAVPRMRSLTTVWFLLDLDADPQTVVPTAAMEAAGLAPTGTFRTRGSILLRWSRVP